MLYCMGAFLVCCDEPKGELKGQYCAVPVLSNDGALPSVTPILILIIMRGGGI